MSDSALRYCAACCCCSGLITGIVLIAVSFSVLEATEMGLDYSSVSKSVAEEKLYPAGRHMLGVGHSFKVYPKDQQTVQFPGSTYKHLEARTYDGLEVVLDLNYQYRLVEDMSSILRIYYDWGLRYDYAYVLTARNMLRDTAANWTAFEFFYNRTEIEAAMQTHLTQRIEADGGLLDDLQLLTIDLPTAFEEELTATEQIRQEIEQVEFEVKDAEVKAANKRQRMFDEAMVETNQKVFEARQMFNEKQKALQILTQDLRAEITSYRAVQKNTNMTTANMFNYIWLQNLQGTENHARLHLMKPEALRCWTDPHSGSCPTAVEEQSFACTASSVCFVVVEGSNLQATDFLRISNSTDCAFRHPDLSAESYAPLTGPSDKKKVFNVGTLVSSLTATVCYCRYAQHAQGCSYEALGTDLPTGLSPAFASIGTLTVS
ncbi:unnamed protein product [Amoebophrya sp. A120]|nr:unnamed protein product [Amoebophrya sp. A120]|eukprot:GSA120T00017536001.1